MMFWGISLFIVLLAGAITLWPLVRSHSRWRLAAVAAVMALPLIIYWMYQGVGTPAALSPEAMTSGVPADGDMATLTEQLRQRLSESPDDIEGWVLLGRSYKSLQNYPKAVQALETAQRLAPGQALIVVELVEARLFASGNPQITAEMTALLEQAVKADPTLQKGLWLLGIAAAQTGDDRSAIGWWERLLMQVQPDGPVSQTVTEQITQARTRLGEPSPTIAAPKIAAEAKTAAEQKTAAEAETVAAESWPGVVINVALGASATAAMPQIPNGAVLFIIAREAGSSGGPPLGVRRISQPVLPLQLTLTDKDSMMPQRPISLSAGIKLQARLSLTGQPTPVAGDWQSTSTQVDLANGELTQLILGQKVE
ncbi:MAG: hypothetical protein EXR85_08480 [Xanthomonadales bacterium]|nr:hypothetical protein [Xanthomonadales bacterium]